MAKGDRACHVSASIDLETAARNGEVARLRRFRAIPRSERVFRNEFPYLGRVGRAARTASRLVGGNRVGYSLCKRGPSPGAGTHGCPEGQGPTRCSTKGCTESAAADRPSAGWPAAAP